VSSARLPVLQGAEEDPDLSLIPTLVESVALPIVGEVIGGVYDPFSTAQVWVRREGRSEVVKIEYEPRLPYFNDSHSTAGHRVYVVFAYVTMTRVLRHACLSE